MNSVTFRYLNGKRVDSLEPFIYKSSDVWIEWGYPSHAQLKHAALVEARKRKWKKTAKKGIFPFCFEGKQDFWFTHDFGIALKSLAEKAKKAKARRRIPRKPEALGDLYFIQDSRTKAIKIGRTINIERRLETLQISFPYKLQLLKVVKGMGHKERATHLMFPDLRLSGEWFQPDAALLEYIDSLPEGQ
ncbi:MAG TPA: GIY-YIG nuclease family protein [Candidatus Obscuribacterales bacterium]